MNTMDELKLGVNSIMEKKFPEAEKIFKTLLKKKPLDPEINHLLGISFQLQNNVHEALKYFRKTIEIKPDFAEAHKNLGNMFYRLGKIFDAEPCYKKAIELQPNFKEAITVLDIIAEQKETLSKILNSKKINLKKEKHNKIELKENPFISTRSVETDLIKSMYEINSINLNQTEDIRYGNGVCSPDLKLFENKLPIIQTLKKDLSAIMKKSVGSEILIVESFFNILKKGSGTTPHKHIDPFDKNYNLTNQKFSLVYYLSIGDQNCSEPGILKLYDPEKELLPSKGLIVIFPANRKHSTVYNGKKDRIMIGVNFYSLS